LFSHALNISQPDNLDARLFIFVTGYLRFGHICGVCDLVLLTHSTLALKPMIKKKITNQPDRVNSSQCALEINSLPGHVFRFEETP